MNRTTQGKKTNYEGRFFGMIILAWAVLAIMFNVLHRELPQPKQPAAAAHGAVAAPPAEAATVPQG